MTPVNNSEDGVHEPWREPRRAAVVITAVAVLAAAVLSGHPHLERWVAFLLIFLVANAPRTMIGMTVPASFAPRRLSLNDAARSSWRPKRHCRESIG
jgi:hypothetical protein